MKLEPVVRARRVVLRHEFLSGTITFIEAYDCTLACGHHRTISSLTHGEPPKKLKCTNRSCKES